MSNSDFDRAFASFNEALENLAERTRLEGERRARLTPEERKSEDDAAAQARKVESSRLLAVKIERAAARYRGHETFTLRSFGAMLHGIDPEEVAGWGFFHSTGADSTIALLESCVGKSLHPVNWNAPRDQLRFEGKDLIAVAFKKKFRGVQFLASALGVDLPRQESPQPAQVANATPTAQARQSDRNKGRVREELVRHSVELLISKYERISGLKLDCRMPLPLTHDIIFECYERLCVLRGGEPSSRSRVREAMPSNYRLMSGNPTEGRQRILVELRNEIRAIV